MTPRCLIAVLAIASWMFAACEATSQEQPEVSATALQKSLNDVKALFGDKYAAARAIRSRNQRRTALVSLADELLEMAETTAVCFVRGKQPQEETIKLAEARKMPLLTTDLSMFESCGRLFREGLHSCDEAK